MTSSRKRRGRQVSIPDSLDQKKRSLLKGLIITDNRHYEPIQEQVLMDGQDRDSAKGRTLRKRLVRLPPVSILKNDDTSLVIKLRYKGFSDNSNSSHSNGDGIRRTSQPNIESHGRSRSGTPAIKLRIRNSMSHNNDASLISGEVNQEEADQENQGFVSDDLDDIVVSMSEDEQDSVDEDELPYRGAIPLADAANGLAIPTEQDKLIFKKALRKSEQYKQVHSNHIHQYGTDEYNHESNLKYIQIRNYRIETWYTAPFPEQFNSVPILYICENCLEYMDSKRVLKGHQAKCRVRAPPGLEIYREGLNSIFEVDGLRNSSYCRNLCLIAKLFLNSKTLFYDVDPFMFYVLTEYDPAKQKHHFVGYFSKEKVNNNNYNVSCILTLPIYQRKGYGNLLIDFSYLLSQREYKSGTPEKPLSDLGAVSYRNYWKVKMAYLLRRLATTKQPKSITTIQLCKLTGMIENDVIVGLEQCQALLRDFTNGQYLIFYNRPVIEVIIMKWESKNYTTLNPKSLFWKPVLLGASLGIRQPITAGKDPEHDYIYENIKELNEFLTGKYDKFEQFEGHDGIEDIQDLMESEEEYEEDDVKERVQPEIVNSETRGELEQTQDGEALTQNDDQVLIDILDQITDQVVNSLTEASSTTEAQSTSEAIVTELATPEYSTDDKSNYQESSSSDLAVLKTPERHNTGSNGSADSTPESMYATPAAYRTPEPEEETTTNNKGLQPKKESQSQHVSSEINTTQPNVTVSDSSLTYIANGTASLMEALVASVNRIAPTSTSSSVVVSNPEDGTNALEANHPVSSTGTMTIIDDDDTDLSVLEKFNFDNFEICFPGMDLAYRHPAVKKRRIHILDDDEEEEDGEEEVVTTKPRKSKKRSKDADSSDKDDSYVDSSADSADETEKDKSAYSLKPTTSQSKGKRVTKATSTGKSQDVATVSRYFKSTTPSDPLPTPTDTSGQPVIPAPRRRGRPPKLLPDGTRQHPPRKPVKSIKLSVLKSRLPTRKAAPKSLVDRISVNLDSLQQDLAQDSTQDQPQYGEEDDEDDVILVKTKTITDQHLQYDHVNSSTLATTTMGTSDEELIIVEGDDYEENDGDSIMVDDTEFIDE
ncbi:hypothetical protein WICPIJ_007442 [Wickerhamomyces pijperi]|uniref:Histone acetyltransferase n=1 Tax=Wickerhamomyces pijperi TaxID=599730 RepID=A0A9P8PZV7_WICPI|nr:hypothetical protein WICPIJ_007442 [Wickerhamomyces pijperi]